MKLPNAFRSTMRVCETPSAGSFVWRAGEGSVGVSLYKKPVIWRNSFRRPPFLRPEQPKQRVASSSSANP